MAIDVHVRGAVEIAVVGDRRDLLETVNRQWLPAAVLAWGEPYPSPLWEHREPGRAYVCEGFTCREPVDSADGLLSALETAERCFDLHLTLPMDLFAADGPEPDEGAPAGYAGAPEPVQIKGLGRRTE